MHSNEARRSIRTKANVLGRCRASMHIIHFTVAGAAVDSHITVQQLGSPHFPFTLSRLIGVNR